MYSARPQFLSRPCGTVTLSSYLSHTSVRSTSPQLSPVPLDGGKRQLSCSSSSLSRIHHGSFTRSPVFADVGNRIFHFGRSVSLRHTYFSSKSVVYSFEIEDLDPTGTARADPGILFPSSRASPLVTRSRQELNYLLVSYFDNVEAQQTVLDQYQTLENVFGINGFTVRSCRSICRIFTRLLFHT